MAVDVPWASIHAAAVRRAVLILMTLTGCALDRSGLGGVAETLDGASVVDTAIEETAVPVDDGASPPSDVGADVEPVFDTAVAETAVDAADDSPPVMLSGCVPGSYGGHTYLFCERDSNWEQARTTCQFAGLDLAVIGDSAENDWLKTAIDPAKSSDFYIGLTDQVKEGDFVWVDGTKPGYKTWAFLQPDDFFGEDCTVLQNDGDWNDVDCTDSPKNAFICESK